MHCEHAVLYVQVHALRQYHMEEAPREPLRGHTAGLAPGANQVALRVVIPELNATKTQ
jgi:hypothetical protein